MWESEKEKTAVDEEIDREFKRAMTDLAHSQIQLNRMQLNLLNQQSFNE